MLKRSIFSATLIFSLLYGINANAFIFTPIVDNCAVVANANPFLGFADPNTTGMSGAGCGTTFNSPNDAVAYQFTLDTPLYIQSIEGGISYLSSEPDQLFGGATISLYNGTNFTEENGYFPGGDKIFSKSFQFDVVPSTPSYWAFRGVDVDNLELEPGNYWIAFTDGIKDTKVGEFYSENFGLRMAAVNTPEPTTMALMGMGLIGAIWRRRKV